MATIQGLIGDVGRHQHVKRQWISSELHKTIQSPSDSSFCDRGCAFTFQTVSLMRKFKLSVGPQPISTFGTPEGNTNAHVVLLH